jgi:DNA-binding SARP family transcriptional activator
MAHDAPDGHVRIELLGRFRVTIGGEEVAADARPGRRAAELVQLLALAEERRLARDQTVEALWSRLDVEAGAANLRKAAHHARRALAGPEAVVLRGGRVALFPRRPVATDVDRFEARAHAAVAAGEAAACKASA